MVTKISPFQDSDDVKNGLVQLSISEFGLSSYLYFTLDEWRVFKEAVNKFHYTIKLGVTNFGVDLESNPLSSIMQDSLSVQVNFQIGELSTQLYFEKHTTTPKNRRWESFKKKINDFVPEEA
jgi:hypothetical protein